MPTWNEIKLEIDQQCSDSEKSISSVCDEVRSKYLKELQNYTKRPIIAYYSGFLQRNYPDGRFHPEGAITDLDMNGFMAVVHNLDRTKGLDLILHTPGGSVEATRSIVEYLYRMFDRDIRVIVPHMAMSCGTMIACGSREILLGKHSSLGPTDPQVRGHPAMGVIAEINRALDEIGKNPMRQLVWQEVFRKYPPAFISDCERAVDGTREMIRKWLMDNMMSNRENPAQDANEITGQLMDYENTQEHAHHIMVDKCKEIGLTVREIESDQKLQENILSAHHGFVATFEETNAIKIIENADGKKWIISV